MREREKSLSDEIFRGGGLVVLLVSALLLLFFARFTLVITLIGIGAGVLISPLIQLLRRKFHIPKVVGAALLFFLILGSVGAIGYGIFFLVADQAKSLSEKAPEIVSSLQERLDRLFDQQPWIEKQIGGFDAGAAAQSVFSSLFTGLQSGLTSITGLVFAFVLGLYTAVGGNEYFRGVVRSFPPEQRKIAENFLLHAASTVRKWFGAQLIDMLIVGSITALGLWIAGVPYWGLFGLLTAIFGIIPYIGVMLVVVVAALITLASEPDKVPWVIGIFVLTQQIEGNIVLPLVMKGQAELPEVPLLIFMLFLGTWLGLIGVFIAPPIFAVFQAAYLHLYLPWIERREMAPAKK